MQASATTHIKNCPSCREDFETKTADRIYCSTTCRNAKHRERERLRDGPKNQLSEAEMDSQRYFMPPIVNPSAELMVKTADLMVATGTKKAVLFKFTEGVEVPQVPMPVTLYLGQTPVLSEWLLFAK